jgi:hypothetical protein
MNKIAITTALALAGGLALVSAQAARQDPSALVAGAGDGLSELSAMTFACPRAGLNVAARQAAKVPSQGTYQFSYFRAINTGHHAAYEVHFTSNYEGEADLKYCVQMYCQQGWDPKTTKATVTLMSTQRPGVNAHGVACGGHQAPATHRSK